MVRAAYRRAAGIEPGSPWENGDAESFNGKLRDAWLNGERFYTLHEARVIVEGWRQRYNTHRPHRALGIGHPPKRLVPSHRSDDGTYYFFYSEQAAPNLIGGLVQGNNTASNGIFMSDNAKDFDFEGGGAQSGTIDATYAERQSLNGSALSAGTGAFTTTFDPAYDTPPGLTGLVSTYSGQSGTPENGVESTTLTVELSGVFSGSAISDCSFTGTMAPRVRGNIFDLSVTFGGAPPCLYAGETLAGIAYLDVPNKHLLAAALTSTRTDVVLFTGIRP